MHRRDPGADALKGVLVAQRLAGNGRDQIVEAGRSRLRLERQDERAPHHVRGGSGIQLVLLAPVRLAQ